MVNIKYILDIEYLYEVQNKNQNEYYKKRVSSELKIEKVAKKTVNRIVTSPAVVNNKNDKITENELYETSKPVVKKNRNDNMTENELYETSKPVVKKKKPTNVIAENHLYSHLQFQDMEPPIKHSRKTTENIPSDEETNTEGSMDENYDKKQKRRLKKLPSTRKISYYEESNF